MTNLMASRQGFYEEEQTSGKGKLSSNFCHSSSSSPSSSSSQHKGLLPLTYHQLQHHQQRGWLEFESNQEETTLRSSCYIGGGGGLELMTTDSSFGNHGGSGTGTGDDDADYHHVASQGDSSDALRGTTVGGSMVVEREHMFDKVVTPSDVGKLNRLVIPKQHAEKYFPLDSSTNEKGLLLNFEDRNGKPWRFRYSYWNSSQSYVMTKGWSRFVKEKKLDAGDIVSFQRGVGELGKDRLFIDWRRRPDAPLDQSLPAISLPHHFPFHRSIHPWSPIFLQPPQAPPRDHSRLLQPSRTNHQSHSHYPNSYSYSFSHGSGSGPYGYNLNSAANPCPGSVIYLRSPTGAAAPQQVGMLQMQRGGGTGVGDGGGVEPMVFESVPVVHGKAAAKRLRLFGVNMECPISESDECDILSSTTIPHSSIATHHHHHLSSSSASSISSLQLRPYNGTPLPAMQSDLLNKGKSSMSLDLDI